MLQQSLSIDFQVQRQTVSHAIDKEGFMRETDLARACVDLLSGAYRNRLILFAVDDQQGGTALFEPSYPPTHGSPQIGNCAESQPFDVRVVGKEHGGDGPS